MKILLASTSSGSRGGGELSLLYLAQALRTRGHTVSLWLSDHPRMDELAALFAKGGACLRSPYANTYDRPGRSVASYLDHSAAERIGAIWRAERPDVIHLNKQNLEDGLDLLAAARCAAVPALAMLHITQSARYLRAHLGWLRDLVARRALSNFPGLLVTTPGSREKELTAFLGSSEKVRAVRNGVPIPSCGGAPERREQMRQSLGIANGQFLCVAVGRMVPQKRPLLFLEKAALLHAAVPEARIFWIGDGALTGAWDAWVAKRGLGEVIRRLPWQRDVAGLLSAADAFLHVAEFEGLAFAILEALAAGLPCAITTNLLAEMPFLDNSNSVAIADNADWVETLRDPLRRASLGEAARQLAEREFSFERLAEDYEKLYQECIARHGAP